MSNFEARDLKLRYDKSSPFVLKGLNLKIEHASFNVLLGQNGSGKSSLLRCLAGLQAWTEGDVLYNGLTRARDRGGYNEGLRYISEDISLPMMRVKELAHIYRGLYPKFDPNAFERILSYASVDQQKTPMQHSRGQQALIQLALGVASGCETLLIDEITATLDPYVRAKAVGELVEAKKQNRTIVVATNIATEFAHLDENVLLIRDGLTYMQGRLSDLTRNFSKRKRPAGVLASGVIELHRDDTSITTLEKSPDGSELPVTLEDLFIYLSARQAA